LKHGYNYKSTRDVKKIDYEKMCTEIEQLVKEQEDELSGQDMPDNE